MSKKRYPLVLSLDTNNLGDIVELPEGDCLYLPNSDICDVRNINVVGGEITVDGVPLSTFSGLYDDLIDKPFIPTHLTELGIIDGANNTVLTAKGDGTYTFQVPVIDYNDILNLPDIPDSILDLNIDDNVAESFLQANGDGTFVFTPRQDILGNFEYADSTITTRPGTLENITIQPRPPGYTKINSETVLVLPSGPTLKRNDLEGAVRWNTDISQYEGHYGGGNWASLGGVRSVDGLTYILPEAYPGASDHNLTFYTNNAIRLTINETDAIFDPSIDVHIEDAIIQNLEVGELSLLSDFVIGDEPKDTLYLNSRISGNIIANEHNKQDIGQTDLRYKDFYIQGQAYINDYKLPEIDGTNYGVIQTNGQGEAKFSTPDFFGGNRVYVSASYGDDRNDGINAPVKTIRRGTEIASKLAYIPAEVIDNFKLGTIQSLRNARVEYDILNHVIDNNSLDTIDLRQYIKDVGRILMACKFDALTGSNYNRYALTLEFTQREKEFGGGALKQLEIFQQLKSLSPYGMNSTTATIVTDYIGDIEDVLLNGAALPTTYDYGTNTNPLITTVSFDRFDTIRNFLLNEFDAFLATFTLAYTSINIQTLVGYFLDAVKYDLYHNSNVATNNALEFLKPLFIQEYGNNLDPIAATFEHLNYVMRDLLQGVIIEDNPGESYHIYSTDPQVQGPFDVSHSDCGAIKSYFWVANSFLKTTNPSKLPVISYAKVDNHISRGERDAWTEFAKRDYEIATISVSSAAQTRGYVDPVDYVKDIRFILDSILCDYEFDGNTKSFEARAYFEKQFTDGRTTEIMSGIGHFKASIVPQFFTDATEQATVRTLCDVVLNTFSITPVSNRYKTKKVGVIVAGGDYNELNPIIVPDNVTILGEKGVIIRPLKAYMDMFKMRNATNIVNCELRDHIDDDFISDIKFGYAFALDDVNNEFIDRRDYAYIPKNKVTIFTPFTIQNTHILSTLGANGVFVDGLLNEALTVLPTQIADGMPEQGVLALINGVTITSFGGVGFTAINDAPIYVIQSSSKFNRIGFLTETGGFILANGCTSSYGLTAIESTGLTTKLLDSDIGYVTQYGEDEGLQTLNVNNLKRPLTNHYIIDVVDQNNISVQHEYENNDAAIINTVTANTSTVIGNTVFFPAPHGLNDDDIVTYDNNGNDSILGLHNGARYYVQVVDPSTIRLSYEPGFARPLQSMLANYTTGDHKFVYNYEYTYVNFVLDSHNDYQDLVVDNSFTYTIIEGNTIFGLNAGEQIRATIAQWDEATFTLTVSIEENADGNKVKFDTASTIEYGVVASNVSVSVSSVTDRYDLYSAMFNLKTSLNNYLKGQPNAIAKYIHFYRPSIVNAINHTWDYVGSGTDYSALPQHGGVINREYEYNSILPGRVYVQGTNEAGDFRVGELMDAYNQAERVEFNSRLAISGLERLAFVPANSAQVKFISTDITLGENEVGGPSNERLVTQKATYDYIESTLGEFLNQELTEVPKSFGVPQLDRRGLLPQELLTPKTTHTAHIVYAYRDRFNIHKMVPNINLIPGDIVIEEYYESVINTSVPVTVARGEVITQANTGATGIVKDDVVNKTRIYLLTPLNHTWSEDVIVDNLSSDVQGLLVDPGSISGVHVTEAYGPSQRRDNYFINTSLKSQYLVLADGTSGNFAFISAGYLPVTGTNSKAMGYAKEYRPGALTSIDATALPSGSGYTDGTYEFVELRTTSAIGGTGALATVTVAGGAITQINMTRTGNSYDVASMLTVCEQASEVTTSEANFIPRSGGSQAEFSATSVENRLYVDIDATTAKTFSASLTNPDYIEDDDKTDITLSDLTAVIENEFYGYPYDDTTPGGIADGGVSTTTSQIKFNADHNLVDGDFVKYDSNGYPEIGGLSQDQTYYVKVIDSATVELYTTYGLHPIEQVDITRTEFGNHWLRTATVNEDINKFYFANHGFVTGQPIKIEGPSLPGNIANIDFYFVGSVTPNTFTLHSGQSSAQDSINGNTVVAKDISSTGSGAAKFTLQTITIVEAVNTSGEFEDAWTSMWKTEIDGDEIVSGIIDPARMGYLDATDETFLRGDNQWHTAVQGIFTTNGPEIELVGPSQLDGTGNLVFHGDVQLTVHTASYDNPALPTSGEETPGIASFDFDHFVINVSNGNVRTKRAFDEGGIIDAKFLNGKEEPFYRNPENLERNVPIERGGTNLDSFLAGDILYAATDIGDGSFTESLTALPIAPDQSILIVDGQLPAWSSTIALTSATIGDIQIGVTAPNEIDTVSMDLILDSFTGETIIDDNTTINENLSVLKDVAITQNVAITGDTVTQGSVTVKDIQIGVTFPNEIDTVSEDLILDSFTGETIIDDNLTVTGDQQLNGNLTVDLDAHIKQDVLINGNTQIDQTLTVTENATINQVQIGVNEPNEIDTLTGDLVLDSFTGLTVINDNLQVTDTSLFDGKITSNGDLEVNGNSAFDGTFTMNGPTTVTGEVNITGDTTINEIQLGISAPNEIDTVSADLIIDSFTGNTIIDDTLTVQDDVTINAKTYQNGDIDITGNELFIGDRDHTGNSQITGTLSVDGDVRVDELQFGKTLGNEIDTVSTDLILDSFTGETIIDDNLTVTGNMTIDGVMTAINTTDLEITDKNITLAKNSGSATNANGAGITVDIGASAPATATPHIIYNSVTDEWNLNKDINIGDKDYITTGLTHSGDLLVDNTSIFNGPVTFNDVASYNSTINATGLITSDIGFESPGYITVEGLVTSNTGYTTPGSIYADGPIESPGGFIGNADTASKWQTPRTVFFQDDPATTITHVTGQFTIDGSADVTNVVLTIDHEVIDDMVADLIFVNGVHTGMNVIYDDAANAMSWEIDGVYLHTTIGSYFTGNTTRGVISTLDVVNGKINFDIDDDLIQDLAGQILIDNTGNYGINTTYDNVNNNVILTLVDDDVRDMVGQMVQPGIQNGITVTYDTLNRVFDFDVNDPVISISGDAVGSATMTNLGDIDIEVTMVSNAVTLGINTTGDYVEHLVEGGGIRITNNSGPTAHPVIMHADTSQWQDTQNVYDRNGTATLAGFPYPLDGNWIYDNPGSKTLEVIHNIEIDTFGHVTKTFTENILTYNNYGWFVHKNGVEVDNIKELEIHGWKDANNTLVYYDAATHQFYIDSWFFDTDTRITGFSWDKATQILTIDDEVYTNEENRVIGTVARPGNFSIEIYSDLQTVTDRGNTTTNEVIINNDLQVNGCDITTTCATFGLLNQPTTVNAFTAGTNIDIGATTGTTSINHNLDVDLDLNVDGGDITTNVSSFRLLNQPTTVNAFKAGTNIDIGATTGTTSINHNLDVDLDLNVDGGDITTSLASFNLLNQPSTINAFTAATNIDIGAASGTTSINHTTDSTSCTTGALVVDGGVGIAKNINVCGNANIAGTTTLVGDTNINGSLDVDTNLNVDGTTVLVGNTNINGSLDVDTNLNVDGTTNLVGNTTIVGDTNINGSLDVDTNLNVDGTTVLVGDTNINGSLDVDTNLNVDGNTNITGTTTLIGDTNINGSLDVDTNLNVDGTTTLVGNTTINGSLDVDTNLNVDGTTTLVGNTTINGSLDIDTDLNVDGCDFTTSCASFNILNEPTTINAFTSATAVNVGAATGAITFNNLQSIFNSTDSLQIPVGTTAQRDPSPVVGQIRYNTSISSFEGFGPGGAWGSLGGVKDVDQDTYLLTELSAGSDEDTFMFYNQSTQTGSFTLNTYTILPTTESTDCTTGALVVAGGAGIGKNLNVCGDTNINGSLDVDTNLNVDGTTVLVGDTNINGSLDVDTNLNVDGTTNLVGNTTLVGDTTINGSLDVDTNLNVDGTTTLVGDTNINGSLDVDTNLNVDGTTTLVGNTNINGSLDVDTNLNVDGTTTLVGSTNINGSLDVDTNLNVDGTTTLVGNTNINGSLDVDTNLNVDGTSSLTGNVQINGTLGVTGATTLSSTLGVSGATTIGGHTQINSTLTATGNTSVGGTLGVSGATTIGGHTQINSTLTATGNTSVGGTLGVSGATSLSSLSTSGNTSIGGTLGVSGATSLSSLSTSGNTSIGGTLGVSGATSLSSLSTSGNTSVGGTLGVSGATSLSSLSTSGNTSIGGTLSTTGNGTIGGDLTVSGGDVYATNFHGTATNAKYADLAENYLADEQYTPGTVLMFGGDKEVTAANKIGTTKVVGVVSTAPAYLMNSELENGTPVALKGRVPCFVVGKVEKGDMLIASNIAGVAIVSDVYIGGAIIGKAIESSDDENVKVIEIAVGVN